MTDAEGAARTETVLAVTRTIGPGATCTHIPFTFALDHEREQLEILFSYTPRVLEDEAKARRLIEEGMRMYADSLGPDGAPERWRIHMPLTNLLTLSLDGPSGFRGCAHRSGNGKPVSLARKSATPGFIPGTIEAGTWTATISVHLVVTEQCDFSLRVGAQ
jgi:hypothetical protein